MGGIPGNVPEVGSGVQFLLQAEDDVPEAEIAAGDWMVVQARLTTEPDQLVALGLDETVIVGRAWAMPPESAVLLGVVVAVLRRNGDVPTGMNPAADLVVDHLYQVTYETRDIGYGVETGDDEFIYRGGPDAWGKHEFEPMDGGQAIYLFPDEIKDLYQNGSGTSVLNGQEG